MKSMGVCTAMLLLPALTNVSVRAQSSEAVALYEHAKPYMDDRGLQLKIRDLQGLRPDPGPVPLSTILDNTAKVIVAELPRVPNLVADEDIAQEMMPTAPQLTGGKSANPYSSVSGVGDPAGSNDLVPLGFRRYEYVILAEHTPEGGTLFNESRKSTGKDSHAATPRGIGFGTLWLLFVPPNISESHFRYLGTQKINGRATFVVAFAQDPSLVKTPGTITTDSGALPLLYQGIAWIDQETYRIVRLRTDLLDALPSIKLWQATSTVDYSEVKIPKFNTPLWLPKSVEIAWDLGGNRLGELHRYSKYKLFTVTSRVLPN